MDRQLDKIDSDDNLLLALALGELEGPQRAVAEQKLAADPSLQSRKNELEIQWQKICSDLAALDDAEHLPDVASSRCVAKSISHWQAERALRLPPPKAARPFRMPLWSYPAAAAAMLFVAFLYWWANGPESGDLVQTGLPAWWNQRDASDDPLPPVELPLAFAGPQESASLRLRSIEDEIHHLSQASDDSDLFWSESTP